MDKIPTFSWDNGLEPEGCLMDLHSHELPCGCMLLCTDDGAILLTTPCEAHS